MNNEQIKHLALQNGFKLKEQPDGTMDLNPYVYDFAKTLISGVTGMKFIKLHRNGREMLVNMSNVSDIYATSVGKCELFLNLAVGDDQVRIKVDESLEDIYEKLKEKGE